MTLTKQIVARALKEPGFRTRLVANAKATIEAEFGVKVPDDMKFQIHENTDSVVHLVLPQAMTDRRLSDHELEQVAGGKGKKPPVVLPTSRPPNTGFWECA